MISAGVVHEGLIQKLVDDAYARGYADRGVDALVRLRLLSDELRLLPEVLVDAYAQLAMAAMSDGMQGHGYDGDPRVKPKVRRVRTSTGQKETRGLAAGARGYASRVGVASVRMLALKDRIDRKLRSLAREIRREMTGGGRGEIRKCRKCGRFGEETWAFCPWDRAEMESEDQ